MGHPISFHYNGWGFVRIYIKVRGRQMPQTVTVFVNSQYKYVNILYFLQGLHVCLLLYRCLYMFVCHCMDFLCVLVIVWRSMHVFVCHCMEVGTCLSLCAGFACVCHCMQVCTCLSLYAGQYMFGIMCRFVHVFVIVCKLVHVFVIVCRLTHVR